jgi:TolB-like protein
VGFVVIVGFIVFNIISRGRFSRAKALLDKSIAVLPFINDCPDGKDVYIINGIMASIHYNLFMIKDLSMLEDRTSVAQYRNVSKPLPDIVNEIYQ